MDCCRMIPQLEAQSAVQYLHERRKGEALLSLSPDYQLASDGWMRSTDRMQLVIHQKTV